MSDSDTVSAEVRELLELVLKEPDQSDTNNVTLPMNDQDSVDDTTSIASMEAQPEIPITTNVEVHQKDVPIVTANTQSHITPAPEPDLRAIESNALKLIAQYGSDSDSEHESDYDTASSDEVVAIDDVVEVISVDDVEVAMQKTITEGNYRVVSSDSEDRYDGPVRPKMIDDCSMKFFRFQYVV